MTENRWVVVTTEYKGTYFGKLIEHPSKLPRHDADNRTCVLRHAKMAIKWGTERGVDELAFRGPTQRSRLGAYAPRVWLCGITSIAECTEAARGRWWATYSEDGFTWDGDVPVIDDK